MICPGCAQSRGPLFPPPDQPLVWPEPPDPARIRWIGSIASSDDLNAAKSGWEQFTNIVRGDRPPISFSAPHGIAVNDNRWLAVSDTGTASVHILDLEERSHLMISGWADERIHTPLGVAWAGSQLFVADAGRHEILAVSLRGEVQRTFGADELERPVGVAFDRPRSRLLVVDGDAHRIVAYSLHGEKLGTIGRRGAGPGEFNYPTHIACAEDRIAVADSGNFRVQVLDSEGTMLLSIGKKGDAAGDFALPKGVAFDSAGRLYVVDAQFENFQILDKHGRLLLAVGHEGGERGEFSLPAGIAIDNDRIWIADAGNHRVQVFDLIPKGSAVASRTGDSITATENSR